MALVVPNASEVIMLNYILNIDAPENISILLFANNVIPDENTTVATFTEVANGLGYTTGGISLTPGSWSVISGNPSQAEHTEVTWTFSGAVGNVYGYYVTRDIGGELLWAERFTNGPFNITTNGDEIKITPRLTLE
jgi:hypothetical protein